MSFANIEYLLLLLCVVPYIVWYVLRHKKRNASIRMSSTKAYENGVKTYKNYIIHLPFLCRTIAMIFIIIVLARPQFALGWQEQEVEGVDIMLAVDISTSMLAEDLTPNRLEAVKNVASQFVSSRENDNIGITLFASDAFTQCPLTVDHGVLLSMISNSQAGMIQDGTAIGMGIANAVSRLKDSKAKSKTIILLTDGTNNSGDISPLTAAEMAKTFGVRIYTIGAGTNGTAPYPVEYGGIKDYIQVPVEIDEKLLTEIADLTGGKYFRATDNTTLKEVYEEIDKLEKTKISVKKVNKKQERFFWFAVIALIAFLLEFLLRNTILRKTP